MDIPNEKKHIPGSLNLYYKTLEDMSKNRMKTAVNKVIKDGFTTGTKIWY